MTTSRSRRGRCVTHVAMALLLLCCGCSAVAHSAGRPNIVYVLTDDLSWNLVRYMPHVRALQDRGVTFTDYTVTDSLCCPSRASIFTGQFPHDTGVLTNVAPDGGFQKFLEQGLEDRTFATQLQAAGYRTAMMGKYLNGFDPSQPIDGPGPYVPPGWTTWLVPNGGAVDELTYTLSEDGRISKHGDRPQDYFTDVMADHGVDFVRDAAGHGEPFFVELASYAPHEPATPAPRDANAFPGLTAPQGPAYGRVGTDVPEWLAVQPPLQPGLRTRIDEEFRKRAQSVLAVDAMLGRIEQELSDSGVLDDTYVIFNSDNGYHMGDHRLPPGKQTAFETDITVPLVVAGPGIRAGSRDPRLVQNIDLAPTFADIAGAPPSDTVDGRSFLPLLVGSDVPWRSAALIEHQGQAMGPDDPDRPSQAPARLPPTYSALRTADATYVEYSTGEREYYDLQADPDQLTNLAARLPAPRRADLRRTLTALTQCHGPASCWTAGEPIS